MQEMKERFVASLILGGVGDAMGYKNGHWEFCYDGEAIHRDMLRITGGKGPLYLVLDPHGWRLSDDTIMTLATARGLLEGSGKDYSDVCKSIGKHYRLCMGDMAGRAPGNTTLSNIQYTDREGNGWDTVPFNAKAQGCGAAMSLRFCKAEEIDTLVAFSIDTGRMTHHSPGGYLGSLVSALFTSYAVQGVRIGDWGQKLLDEVIPRAISFVKKSGCNVPENLSHFSSFVKSERNLFEYAIARWEYYLNLRGIREAGQNPTFPSQYGVGERDRFYNSKEISPNGWGGACGVDSTIISYDAILGSTTWEELILRAVLHGGDNDSTGEIACSWWGALHGVKGVPPGHHENLEYRWDILNLGALLYERATK